MSTIDYSQFQTATGYWSGSNISAPDYLRDYQIISQITDLDSSNPIITFTFNQIEGDDNYNFEMSQVSNKLKVVSMAALETPFDTSYVDISDYNDYIVIKNNSGVWNDKNASTFTVAYTSGGFWAMGPTGYESPGVMFRAYPTGIGDYSYDSIFYLGWSPINQFNLTDYLSSLEYDLYFTISPETVNQFEYNLNYSSSFEPITNNILINFNSNSQSWQRARINIIDVGDITGITVSGLDSTSTLQTIVFTGGPDFGDNSIVEFYWNEDILYKETSPNMIMTPPEPFNNSAFSAINHGTAAIYPDEPMIHYTVIDDHTIQIDTAPEQVEALIPPLRKLNVNFSAITS
jgi:hypothetical protein